MEVRTCGFLLSFIPYEEKSEIAVFFTPLGLYEVIRRKGRGKDPLERFAKYTLLIREKREGLSQLVEAGMVDAHLFLREKIEWIEAAALLWEAVRKSQMPQEPSERLYEMVSRFFYYMPMSRDLGSLHGYFLLKLLVHEGEEILGKWKDFARMSTFREIEAHPIPRKEQEAISAFFAGFLRK